METIKEKLARIYKYAAEETSPTSVAQVINDNIELETPAYINGKDNDLLMRYGAFSEIVYAYLATIDENMPDELLEKKILSLIDGMEMVNLDMQLSRMESGIFSDSIDEGEKEIMKKTVRKIEEETGMDHDQIREDANNFLDNITHELNRKMIEKSFGENGTVKNVADPEEVFEELKKMYVLSEVTSGDFMDFILKNNREDMKRVPWNVLKEAAQKFCDWDDVDRNYIEWEEYDKEYGNEDLASPNPMMESSDEKDTQTLSPKQTRMSQNIPLLSIDVQPAYFDGILFSMPDYISMLNDYEGPIIYMYNGEDLSRDDLGMIKKWLMSWGAEEELLDRISFVEKDYAWIRSPIDMGISHDDIVLVLKKMIWEKINDSRDLDMDEVNNMDISGEMKEFIIEEQDVMFLPDITEKIEELDRCRLVGGGAQECLLEVKLLLDAVDSEYSVDNRFVYGGTLPSPMEEVEIKSLIKNSDIDCSEEDTIQHKNGCR